MEVEESKEEIWYDTLDKITKGDHTISDNSDTNIDLNKATKDPDQRNYPIKGEVEESKEEMWYDALDKITRGDHTISDNSDANIDLNKAIKDSDKRNYPINVEVVWYDTLDNISPNIIGEGVDQEWIIGFAESTHH